MYQIKFGLVSDPSEHTHEISSLNLLFRIENLLLKKELFNKLMANVKDDDERFQVNRSNQTWPNHTGFNC